MDVKLQIEVAIVSYHGKLVFVRMITKNGEYIVSVEASSGQRNRLRGERSQIKHGVLLGVGAGSVAIGERGNNGVDGLVPIGFREFLAHGAKKRKKGPSLVLGQAKECVAIQHYHFNVLVDLNALNPVSPLGR